MKKTARVLTQIVGIIALSPIIIPGILVGVFLACVDIGKGLASK